MKTKNFTLSILVVTLLLLYACSSPAPIATPAPSAAGIQATSTSGQNEQSTQDAAAQAKSTEAQATTLIAVATAVQATLVAQPTPDISTMTEQEVGALVEKSVNQAMTDANSAATSTTQAASDGTITGAEAADTLQTVYKSYFEIGYAEELISAYNVDYGDYGGDAASTLVGLQDQLTAISQSLAEIDATLTQGADKASAALDPLNAAAGSIQTKTGEAQNRAKSWSDQITTSIGQREISILKLSPSQVVGDRAGAILQAYAFLDAYKAALADGKFSPDELNQVGQLSANARASLVKTGDPELQKFTGIIEGLTRNAARGEWGSARAGIGILERILPKRPAKN